MRAGRKGVEDFMKGTSEKRSRRLRKTRAASRTASRSETARVQDWERLLSGLAGAVLAFDGIRRKSAGGVGMALLGGGLMYRGFSGRLPLDEAVHITMQMFNQSRNGHASGAWVGLQKLLQRDDEPKSKADRHRAA